MRVLWLAAYPGSDALPLRRALARLLAPADAVPPPLPDLREMTQAGRRLALDSAQDLICTSDYPAGPQHPQPGHTLGFVLLLRHPWGVIQRATAALPDSEAILAMQHFIQHMSLPGVVSWPEYMTGWLAAAQQHPHLFLRLEDVEQRPAGALGLLLQFLGQPRPAEHILQAWQVSGPPAEPAARPVLAGAQPVVEARFAGVLDVLGYRAAAGVAAQG
jgi:hypothetical protein